MKILVTGANGFVGSCLSTEAERRSCTVTRLVRVADASASENHVVVGDVATSTSWSHAFSDVDAVVHLAARVHVMDETASDPLAEFRKVNTAGTLRLAQQAAEAGVKRFVLVSSIKVNGEGTTDRPFTERDAPNPQDPYAISKAEAEEALWSVCAASGMEGVVIRPPLVYGPEVRGNFERLMALVDKGLPLPLGLVDNRRSLVGLDNLVDLILTCVQHPAAAGQTFLAGDGEDLSTAELIRRIASAMNRSARLLPVPVGLLRMAGRLTGKSAVVDRLCGNLQVDIRHAQDALGWYPPVPINEALAQTVRAWLGTKR